ncbi:MAG: ABC transporter ATP-binding protein [Atribacterota bacterium]|jgi:putative ABC transport system ATP-binding protein|nr:ABC transporter ATP-binding protein [Atribacterota bacterium]MDD4895648.1 ABC transporter ATP-binding protein [Atribacterota bacterium]MDD5637352.1 ABC transporter ATP-binding protein [Atribacterota bacterium]
MSIVMKTEKLKKVYHLGKVKVEALRGVSFEVEEGEFVSIMGPSGSGKSTLMHIIGCLDYPSGGKYFLTNQDVAKLNDNQLALFRNKKIGFVFQQFNLLPRVTNIRNVEIPLIYAGVSTGERQSLALKALQDVGLSNRAQHRPNEISGGERQRVAIARALVNNPSIILADEPTGNLDSKTGKEIMKIFQNLNQRGNTIILVTHELEISRYARRIIHLRDGLINEVEVVA